MAPRRWLVRVEGVNFDATIDDTNDLSTMRGGSLALLALDEAVQATLPDAVRRLSGASQAVFEVHRDGPSETVAEDLRAAVAARFAAADIAGSAAPDATVPPFGHLTVVVDVVELAGDGEAAFERAVDRLEAKNHARQLRQWTVVPLPLDTTPGRRADPLDGIRPGTVEVFLPKGKVLALQPDPDRQSADAVALSRSVAARRAYGRRQRQMFYRRQLPDHWRDLLEAAPDAREDSDDTLYSFTDTVEDIVAEPPEGLARSVEGKIAVVYADGNGFTEIRARAGRKTFDADVRTQRSALLRAILDWYARSERATRRSPFVVWEESRRHPPGRYGLRLETLLWGGDEFIFVMPAWLAIDFVRGFFDFTRAWQSGGEPLTHAMGVVIAHHKTPIRLMRRLAHEAADLAKAAGLNDRNSVTFDIFESLAVPDIPLGVARAPVYRSTDDWDAQVALAAALAVSDDELPTLIEQIAAMKGDGGEGFPRSQLYGALRRVRAAADEDYRAARPGAIAEEHFAAYARRMGLREGTVLDAIPRFVRAASVDRRALAFDVAMTAQLWDYVRPLGAPLPAFPPAEAAA